MGPPSAWDDDERLKFLGAVKELGGTLRRIEALHFERLADDGEPFEAFRHTFTGRTARSGRGWSHRTNVSAPVLEIAWMNSLKF